MSEPRILVTGGGSGIGAAIARRLRDDGYAVDCTMRSRRPRADGQGAVYVCDFTDQDSIERLVVDLEASGRSYCGLVHNAGLAQDALISHIRMGDARALMDVNFWAFVRLVKALAPAMLRRRAGRIIAVTSVAAERGARGNAIYGASKAALHGFLLAAAQEFAPRGVTVNAVAPGFVETAMLARYGARREAIAARVPLGRLGAPEDVADLVAYLLGEGAAYITGACLRVDGGLSTALA